MNTFLITYNLLLQLDEQLIIKIKSFGYWARPLPNVWLIKTTNTKESVMNYLNTGLFVGDKILIIEVTNEWISLNLDKQVIEWMRGGL